MNRDMNLLQIYRAVGLRQLWEEKTQKLIDANPHIAPARCGEIVAACLAHRLANEVADLDSKMLPFTMTAEEADMYDWLYVGENACYRADLQEWSGTKTMLADTPDGIYTPEWMQYIRVPEDDLTQNTITPQEYQQSVRTMSALQINDPQASMKHRLLCCLERLIAAMEAESSVPDVVFFEVLGRRCWKPRTEVLCEGYRFREHADAQALAGMLLQVCIGLTMFDFATALYKLRSLPDVSLIRDAVESLEEYKENEEDVS